MKYWNKYRCLCLLLAAVLLMAGCTRPSGKEESGSVEIEELPEEIQTDNSYTLPEDPAEDDWARARPNAEPAADRLLRVSKYDGAGQLMSWVDYEYADSGRLVKETPRNADNSPSSDYTYTYEYVNGWLVAKNARSAAGALVYRYRYNENGQEYKWILYAEDGSVRMWYVDAFDAQGSVISHTLCQDGAEPRVMNLREYDYNESGDPVECRYLNSTGTVLSRSVYLYEYDSAGRMLELKQQDPDGSSVLEWFRYEYDDIGRLKVKSQYEAGEGVVVNEYDDAGRLIEQTEKTGGDRCVIQTRYDYDGAGRIAREYLYNAAGELSVILEYTWQ